MVIKKNTWLFTAVFSLCLLSIPCVATAERVLVERHGHQPMGRNNYHHHQPNQNAVEIDHGHTNIQVHNGPRNGYYHNGKRYKYYNNGRYYNYYHNNNYYVYYNNGHYYNYYYNNMYYLYLINGIYYNYFYKGQYYKTCVPAPGNPSAMICH